MFTVNMPEKAFPRLFDFIYGKLKKIVTGAHAKDVEIDKKFVLI